MMKPKQRLSRYCLLLALVALTGAWTPMRAQTTDEQGQQLIPATVSEQAQAFYARARTGTVPASDAADPERLERIRNMLGRMFRGFAEDISTDFELVAQDLDGVPGFWVKPHHGVNRRGRLPHPDVRVRAVFSGAEIAECGKRPGAGAKRAARHSTLPQPLDG